MKLPPVRTLFRLILAIWFIGGFALIVIATELNSWWVILALLAFAVVINLGGFLLRCPRCHKAVLINPVRIFGVDLYVVTATIPKKCTRCGEPL